MSGLHRTSLRRRAALLMLAGMPMVAQRAAWSAEQAAIRPRAPVREAGYKLVKNWDFTRGHWTQDDLRKEFHTRFIYDNGRLDHVNDEWSRYRDNDNHVFTREGLSLVARAVGKAAPGRVESGMLRSRWFGQFGVFEARLRVPRGRGTWPAFWLGPQDLVWPPEIDVVEVVNNGRDDTRRSFHFLHGVGAAKQARRTYELDKGGAYKPGFDYADGFHDFAVEWTPTSVRHYVDEVLVADRDYRWVHNDGRPGGDAHLLVNLAIGGGWPGAPAADALPASLTIGHIRVWQR